MKHFLFIILLCLSGCFLGGSATAQNTTVTGKVTDEYALPMVGVTVSVRDVQTAVVTDAKGEYSISVPKNGVLVFSFVGYKRVEEPIGTRSQISLRMEPEAIGIGSVEVVAAGYGSLRKKDLTGSIAAISGEELVALPSMNALEAIGSKIAGVQILNDGEPGEGASVRIRGIGSYNDAQPICVIDGQFFEVSELSTLNSADIESISFLKDASATAIYGSRGANGVIIVTTKTGAGEKGGVRVNAGAYFSISEMERYLPTATKSQWQQIENLAYLADNWKNPNAAASIPYPDWRNAGEGTDWQKLVSRKAFSHNYNLSVAGSSNKTDYFISATMLDQQGVIRYNDYTRFTARAKATYKPTAWLTLGLNSTFITDNRTNLERDVLSLAGKRLPQAPIYNNAEAGDSEDNFNGGDSNPYALLHYTHDRYNKSWQYANNFFVEVAFLRNFTWRSSISNTNVQREQKVFLPAFMENVADSNSPYKVSRFRHNTNANSNWLQENTLTYNLVNSVHRLNAVAGFTLQSYRTQYANLSASGLPWSAWKNRNLWYVGQGTDITGTDGGSEKTYASFLARINYTVFDRYILTLTGRIDGSSAYPSDNRYGFFPAIGAGWIASEENFLRGSRWLDLLKLRASYGVVGNDSGVTAAQMLYADAVDIVMGDGTVAKSDALRLMIDNSLTWEETRTFNVGFDLSIRKRLFELSVEYYNKKTSNVMMPLNIPPSNFIVTSNIGTIRNQGMELTLRMSPRIGKVNTSFQFTATTVDNEVLRINDKIGPITNLPNYTLEGYPVGGLWGLQTIGVFQNEEQLAQMPKVDGTRVGDLMFRDVNGDGMISNDDYVYLGSYLPKALLGFTGRVDWKGFIFSFELSSALGHKSFNRRMQQRQPAQNYMTGMLDAWHGEGTSNTHPRVFSWSDVTGAQNSDYFIENCDYLSLSNIQLAYNFQSGMLRKIGFRNLRVYLNVSNLYTWTAMTGYNPDVMPRGSNANSGGLDTFGLYPKSRTYTAGFSFTF